MARCQWALLACSQSWQGYGRQNPAKNRRAALASWPKNRVPSCLIYTFLSLICHCLWCCFIDSLLQMCLSAWSPYLYDEACQAKLLRTVVLRGVHWYLSLICQWRFPNLEPYTHIWSLEAEFFCLYWNSLCSLNNMGLNCTGPLTRVYLFIFINTIQYYKLNIFSLWCSFF